jgi:hypothetical protein
MFDILHEIVNHLPIHDKAKQELHDKITAVNPEEEKEDE